MIRPAAQSSYIRANKVSTSAFRFSAFFSSAACFFLAAACPLSVAFNSCFKSRSSSCCTSPDQYCRRRGHRHKAHHNGYSAWSIGVCPARTCYNDNGRKACCSACSPHRTATSRNPHILPIRKNLRCTILALPAAVCYLLLYLPENLLADNRLLRVLHPHPFTLGLAYPPLVLKGNVRFPVMNGMADIGFVFHNALDLGYRPCVAFSSGAPA